MMKKITLCAFLATGTVAFAQNWESTGDLSPTLGNSVGISDLASYNGNLFVTGIGFEGLYKSADNGSTWTILNGSNGIPTGSSVNYSTIEVLGSRIYVGQTSNGNGDIYYSDDEGVSWHADTAGLPKGLSGLPRLHVHQMDIIGDHVHVTLDGPNNFYKKKASDPSWTKIDAGIPRSNCMSGDTLWGNNNTGLQYSHDGGATWISTTNTGIPMNAFGTTMISTYGLAKMNGAIFISGQDVFSTPANQGVFKSTDWGENWSLVGWDGQNENILDLYAFNGELFGFSGAWSATGLVKSSDGGATWTDISDDIGSPAMHFLEHNNSLYVGTSKGVYKYGAGGSGGNAVNEVASAHVAAFPNPASSVLNVRAQETIVGVMVIDVSGTVVSSSVTNETLVSLDVESLAAGVYTVQVSLANGSTSRLSFVK